MQGVFSFSTTNSDEHFFDITSSFTRLNEATKHVCPGPISLLVNFHTELTMQSAKLLVRLVTLELWEKRKEHSKGKLMTQFFSKQISVLSEIQLFFFVPIFDDCDGLLY